jgi:hypothetical protein
MGVCKHVVARSCWGNTGRGGEFPSDRARARRFRVPVPVPFLEALRRGMGESNERLSLAQYQAAEGGMSAISNWMPLDLQCQPARPQLRRARLGWRTQQQREPLPRPATLDQFACGEPLFRIPCGLRSRMVNKTSKLLRRIWVGLRGTWHPKYFPSLAPAQRARLYKPRPSGFPSRSVSWEAAGPSGGDHPRLEPKTHGEQSLRVGRGPLCNPINGQ